jgi:chromosome segregation ATPase
MSDEKLSKDVFEAHMTQIHKNMDAMNNNIVKLFERQDDMNVVLTKNTVVVKEHHARSNRFETVVEEISERFVELGNQFIELKTEVRSNISDLEDDIEPIKNHVSQVSDFFGFIRTMPKFLKTIVLILTIASSSIGIFTITESYFLKPLEKHSLEAKIKVLEERLKKSP